MKKLMPVVIAVGLIFFAPGLSRADIINGDFSQGSDGLFGWSTYDTTRGGFDPNSGEIIPPTINTPSASVSVVAGQAVMATQPPDTEVPSNSIGQITLYQGGVSFPDSTIGFWFDVGFSTTQDYECMDCEFTDVLSASYVDATDSYYDGPNFFNIDRFGAYDSEFNPLTSVGIYDDLYRFYFDITGYSGRTGKLLFDLFDQEDGYSSVAKIDKIRFETDSGPAPVPEPGTMLLLGSGLAGLAGFRRKRKEKTH